MLLSPAPNLPVEIMALWQKIRNVFVLVLYFKEFSLLMTIRGHAVLWLGTVTFWSRSEPMKSQLGKREICTSKMIILPGACLPL